MQGQAEQMQAGGFHAAPHSSQGMAAATQRPLLVGCDHLTHQPLPVIYAKLIATPEPWLVAEKSKEHQSTTATVHFCRESTFWLLWSPLEEITE